MTTFHRLGQEPAFLLRHRIQPSGSVDGGRGLGLAAHRTISGRRGNQGATILLYPIPESPLEIQVGVSSASPEGALAGLETIKGKSFDQVRREAEGEWEKELGKIRFESAIYSLKTLFYTSLYRTALAPVQFSDARGEYWGPDGKIHRAENYRRYDIFSLWDTFRAANPLYTLTQPDKINDMVRSLLDHYQQYGLLPVWSLLGTETNTMTGYHAVPVLVDAYLKGFRDYDADLAYQSLLTSAAQNIRGSNFYREYGISPTKKRGNRSPKPWSMDLTTGVLPKWPGRWARRKMKRPSGPEQKPTTIILVPCKNRVHARQKDGWVLENAF